MLDATAAAALRSLRRRVERATSPRTPREVRPRFRRAFRSLRPGDVAIDCGANVGKYTEVMAAAGATVYAIEPDPSAYGVLADRFAGSSNVVCLNAAAADADGEARLHLHVNAREDPLKWSVGSSLLAEKGNVDPENYVTVTTVDLDRLIGELGPVRLLKMDVEGLEFRILRRLVQTGRIAQIDWLLVEAHDERLPFLADDAQPVRRALSGRRHVRLDWD